MNKNKITNGTKIILASASPRRRELLTQIGLDFQVLVSDVEEKITTDIPWEIVQELAEQKAMACYERLTGKTASPEAASLQTMPFCREVSSPMLVIGADTIVYCNGKILGKPAGEAEAVEMLRELQNNSHQVYTGVTLLYGEDRDRQSGRCRKKTFYECTTVHISPMTEEEIRDYTATGEPLDKAGAYGIQGLFAKFIKGIEGDYNNVVGLPVARLYREAKEWL